MASLNYTTLSEDQARFYDIVSTSELIDGQRLFVEIGRQTVVIFNIAGNFYAIGDVCSHDDGPVGDGELEGFEIICPRHGARFDIRSGEVLALPAVVDIPAYPVRVVEGMIQLGIPIS